MQAFSQLVDLAQRLTLRNRLKDLSHLFAGFYARFYPSQKIQNEHFKDEVFN
jgi:hypothetical protein